MKYKFLKTIFLLSLLLFLGCGKAVENKLDGTWRRIDVGAPTSGIFEEWQFDGDNFYIFNYNSYTSDLDTLSFGEYNVSYKWGKRILNITSSYSWYSGKFRIDKLSRNTLIIYRDIKPLEYIEFTKK
jgi:hypothetical protein